MRFAETFDSHRKHNKISRDHETNSAYRELASMTRSHIRESCQGVVHEIIPAELAVNKANGPGKLFR